MKRSMKEIIKSKTTEELEERKKELYQKILYKRRLLVRYEHLIIQIEGNCSEFVREYEMIDRVVFFREGRVKIVSSERKTREKKEEPLVKKEIRLMNEEEQATLLEQLLKIRKARQLNEEEGGK